MPERRKRGSCFRTPWRCWQGVALSHLTLTPRLPLFMSLLPKATLKSWSEHQSTHVTACFSFRLILVLHQVKQLLFIALFLILSLLICFSLSFLASSSPCSGCCYSAGWTWTAGTLTAGRLCMRRLTGGKKRCAPFLLTTCVIWVPSTTWWAGDKQPFLGIRSVIESFALAMTNHTLWMSL